MGSSVLECFPKLLKDKTNERLEGGIKLLQHLSKERQENGESKELNHVLKRLVRGLGSSKINSRKGFYSTFTVFLSLNPDIKLEKIFNIINEELKTSKNNSKSEFADINNGRILACGALIRSKILQTYSLDEQKKVLECLLHAGKQRSYLTFGSISFIVEFLNHFENKESLIPIWPIIEQEICKPLSEQSLDTFYVLLIVEEKFPGIISKKTLKKCFGNENILNKESIKDILKLLTDIPRIICFKHPIYKLFCKKIVNTEYLEQFWIGIDEYFIKPSKTVEFLGVELFNILVETIEKKADIPILLSPNFLKVILNRFLSNTDLKSDKVASSFQKGLKELVKILDKEVKSKIQISVLKKLILYPGDLMIEKITGIKVIQFIISNLNIDGVKKLSCLFGEIAANTKYKEKADSVVEPWTNVERTYALQLLTSKLMGHPLMSSEHEWRVDQLKFLFNLGLCEVPSIGVELVSHFKESFFRALDNKLPKLDDLRTVMNSLISHIDKTVIQSLDVKLRTPLDDISIEAWNKMMTLNKKLNKNSEMNENIKAVFHTMNLHMGLQLFCDPEMAISSIDELRSCMERLSVEKKANKINTSMMKDEPEWVEVVVDLMLSLLSRKSHLLRSLVGCVFPHICPHLTQTAIHQILDILDVKSNNNPLTLKRDEESDSELESIDGGEYEEDEENSEDENNETIAEESDSDMEESENEDETVTDRLRLAVRQALGNSTMQTDDEDEDVDNINEEEGKQLDESLAAAFRMLKDNRKSQMKKQEKNAQTLTHFRIRVLDLLEIYLETNPSMALTLDMLIPLFALLEFSIKDPHQKPLEMRVISCLKKLSSIKKFKCVEGVNQELLTTVLKTMIDKGERSASICKEMGDKLTDCCLFLVRCSQQTNESSDSFIQLFGENLTAFFKKRDCILPLMLFNKLMKRFWIGNWHLAPLLVTFAFDDLVKSYRRAQALELLTIFYGNVRLIKSDDYRNERLKLEKKLCKSSIDLFHELSSARESQNEKLDTNVGKEVKQKYICFLLTLLHIVHIYHIPEAWNWKKIADNLGNYRMTASLAKDAKRAYNKLANRIGATNGMTINNSSSKKQNNEETILNNGNQKSDSEGDSSNNEITINDKSNISTKFLKKSDKKRKKNSSKRKEIQKLKKETSELRTKAMSQGLESLDFSTINISNGVHDETTENNNSKQVKQSEKIKNKRSSVNNMDVPSKKKRKAAQSGD